MKEKLNLDIFLSKETTITVSDNNKHTVYGIWINRNGITSDLNIPKSPYSVFAIKGITRTIPMTYLLGAQLFTKVPIVHRSGFVWIMNMVVYKQLMKLLHKYANVSRGTGMTPPPWEMEGCPILLINYKHELVEWLKHDEILN